MVTNPETSNKAHAGKPPATLRSVDLSAADVGAHFFVTAGTVMDWLRQGMIPKRFLRQPRRRPAVFKPGVIAHLEARIEELHARRRKTPRSKSKPATPSCQDDANQPKL